MTRTLKLEMLLETYRSENERLRRELEIERVRCEGCRLVDKK
jgi:hypothetical protein